MENERISSERRPLIRRAAIIGLGGTGVTTILHIKKILHQYYRQIPLSINFLALDTTDVSEKTVRFRLDGKRQTVKMEPHEFFYLPVDNPLELIESSDSIRHWWPEQLPARAIKKGAGGVRAIGRLALHAHAPDVFDWMENAFNSLSDMDLGRKMKDNQGLELVDRTDIEVYVISSLSGGTGSGSFLDIGFMAKHLMTGLSSKIYGFFLLPRAFGGLPATARRNANAYAAIKEIDHFMDMDYQMTKPVFLYGGEEVEAQSPPYDIVNLIDGKNENGATILGPGGQKAVENVCEMLATGIGLNVGSIGKVQDDVLDNLSSLIGTQSAQDWGGKNAHYSSFGVSSLVYPVEKHFNQFYSLYCLRLIEDGLRMSRKRPEEEIDYAQINDDVQNFLTQEGLRDEADNVVDALIEPGKIDTEIAYPEDYTPDDTRGLAQEEETTIKNSIKKEIENNLPRKQKEAAESLRNALKKREKEKGPDFAIRFAEKVAGVMQTYKETRIQEIESHEDNLKNMRSESNRFLDQAKEMGLFSRLRKKQEKTLQAYLDQISREIEEEQEIERKRGSLKVFDVLLEEVGRYINGLNLTDIEKTLSLAKIQVEKDIFRTTYLPMEYGAYSLIVEPKTAVVEAEGKARGRSLSFDDFISERGITIDFGVFLEKNDFRIAQLNDIPEKQLRGSLIEYSQEKMSLIKDMSIEKVLTYDARDDSAKKMERLKYWIKEASGRATPLWFHKAMGEYAAKMEELFIVGVEHEGTTIFKTKEWGTDLLPYLRSQKTAYPPNFTSTMDPYKIFLFKYKAPLPAYLLRDMDKYRGEYNLLTLDMTPHIEKEIELNIPDLFPETVADTAALKVFSLATSPAFSLIKSETEFERRATIEKYYIEESEILSGETWMLGNSRLGAFEELKKTKNLKLRNNLAQLLNEKYEKNRSKISESMSEYMKTLENNLNEMLERVRDKKKQGKVLTMGEVILLDQEIKVLKDFLRSERDVKGFLEEGVR